MFQIDDKIISDDIFEVKFVCDLKKCKGLCCVEGDSGAQLEEKEILIIEKNLPILKKYIPEISQKIIEEKGFYEIDFEGDCVTTTVDDKECVFVYYDEHKIAKCSIEKAFINNEISFRKPISCYLYPIRLKYYKNFIAINYDKQKICNSALIKGKKENVPLFVFLKEPLIIKFGEEFYDALVKIYEEFYMKKGR